MPKKRYDHHKKAGNQGDVIKHVGLIAALDSILKQHARLAFCYADTFAGYARNPLRAGGEWKYGIGKLIGKEGLDKNEHLRLYRDWYLSRPRLVGGCYPGSSLIAADVCAWHRRSILLRLWDISPKVVQDLKGVFGSKNARIFQRCAEPDEPAIRSADFIFIDPPNLKPATWESIYKFLSDEKPAILVWLPVNADTTTRPPGEHRQSVVSRNEALDRGFDVTRVKWARGGHMIGCELVYRLPQEAKNALRAAVDYVAEILGWCPEHFKASTQ